MKHGEPLNMESVHLSKYAQIIPAEMMAELQSAARAKNVSLDIEIAIRLLATMTEPEAFTQNELSMQILKQDLTIANAIAESKHNRQSWLYLYEMEKLRLFLRFERKLPRNTKERFIVVDVKEAAKQIKAELEAEDKIEQGE